MAKLGECFEADLRRQVVAIKLRVENCPPIEDGAEEIVVIRVFDWPAPYDGPAIEAEAEQVTLAEGQAHEILLDADRYLSVQPA